MLLTAVTSPGAPPELFTAWWLLQKGVGVLQTRACFSAQLSLLQPVLPVQWIMQKLNKRKKYSLQLATIYPFLSSCFSFTFHSSPCEADLVGNLSSLILPWLPLSSEDTGDSLLDLSHLKCYWQIAWWIQLSKFSVATKPVLMDFIPEVNNLALFSFFFFS